MFNRITSAGTAPQKRSKCSCLARCGLLLAIPMLSAVVCQAQTTKDSLWSNMSINMIDSCWWENKTDTIKTDFVITVDENNFLKKQKTDFIVHKYEKRYCQYSIMSFWAQNKRNDIYLLDGKPVEVLLYRPKNQYGVLVGNSR